MPAPTLVSYTEIAWNTAGTSKATAAVTWKAGDFIVCAGAVEDATDTITGIAATGLTLASGGGVGTAGSTCWVNTWTATAGADENTGQVFTGTATQLGARHWGFGVWVFRGHGGVGARATDITTAKTVSLTRTGVNSLIVGVQGDFSAASTAGYGFTPALGGGNDRQHLADGTSYSVYVADWGNQGGAGATSYGTSGETSTGTFAKVALEIKGTADAGGAAARYAPGWRPGRGLPGVPGGTPFYVPPSAGVLAAAAATDIAVAESGTAADTLAVTAAVPLADAGSAADALTVTAAVPLAEAGSGADTLTVAAAVSLADAGSAVETLVTGSPVSLADAGSAADTLAVSGAIPLAEAGASADTLAVTAAVPLAEAGASADTLTVAAAVPLADAGTGTDTLSVAAGGTPALAETGTGADTLAVTAAVPLAEAGTGLDTFLGARQVTFAEAGTAGDALAVDAAVPLADAGTAAQTLTALVALALADAGAALGTLSVQALLPFTVGTLTAATAPTSALAAATAAGGGGYGGTYGPTYPAPDEGILTASVKPTATLAAATTAASLTAATTRTGGPG